MFLDTIVDVGDRRTGIAFQTFLQVIAVLASLPKPLPGGRRIGTAFEICLQVFAALATLSTLSSVVAVSALPFKSLLSHHD